MSSSSGGVRVRGGDEHVQSLVGRSIVLEDPIESVGRARTAGEARVAAKRLLEEAGVRSSERALAERVGVPGAAR